MAGGVWAYYIGFIYPQFAIDPLITIGMVLMAYPRRQGDALGPGPGCLHPGAGAAVPRLPARRERALPDRLLGRLPGRHAAHCRAASCPRCSRFAHPRQRQRPAGRFRDEPGADGTMTPLLAVEALTKRFGGVAAVDGCSFAVEEGTRHCPDRSQRIGQDHRVQPDHRLPAGRLGQRDIPRARGTSSRPDAAGAGRTRADVPARTRLRAAHCAREPRRRPAAVVVGASAKTLGPPNASAPKPSSRNSVSRESRTIAPARSPSASASCSSSPPC